MFRPEIVILSTKMSVRKTTLGWIERLETTLQRTQNIKKTNGVVPCYENAFKASICFLGDLCPLKSDAQFFYPPKCVVQKQEEFYLLEIYRFQCKYTLDLVLCIINQQQNSILGNSIKLNSKIQVTIELVLQTPSIAST